MKITPIQKTNFTAYTAKDVKNLQNYTTANKKGALWDLYKKFDASLVESFKMTDRIKVENGTQNWKLGARAYNSLVTSTHNARPKGGFYSKVGH